MQASLAGLKPGLTNCEFISSEQSGMETVSFHVIISKATLQRYHFEVRAVFLLETASGTSALESSGSQADFYVSVVNSELTTPTSSQISAVQSTPFTTSPTTQAFTPATPYTASYTVSTNATSLQMPQTPQTLNSPSVDFLIPLVLAIIAIAVVALFAILLYSRRGKNPKAKTKKPQSKTKNVEPEIKKTTPSKNFCIECGKELELGSKFCNNCGTKQP